MRGQSSSETRAFTDGFKPSDFTRSRSDLVVEDPRLFLRTRVYALPLVQFQRVETIVIDLGENRIGPFGDQLDLDLGAGLN